jgi:putative transposase
MNNSTRNILYRIYPSKKQTQKLSQWLELHRELYNATLQERIEAYKMQRESINYNTQQNYLPQLKKDLPELVELGSQALQETIRRVDRAYKAFFRRIKHGETPGFPRYKSKNRFNSFTYPAPAGWDIINNTKLKIKISKLGLLKTRGKSRFAITNCERRCLTIKRKNNKWYAVITVRVNNSLLKRKTNIKQMAVGIDMGCKSLAVLSDSNKIDNPKYLKLNKNKLLEIQRKLSKQVKFSNNWYKTKNKLSKLHEKIANQRKDFLHKTSAKLVTSYSIIGIEHKLDVKKMTKSARGTINNHGKDVLPMANILNKVQSVKQKASLNRSILEASINIFTSMLKYKAEEAGTVIIEVNKKNTSRECSVCHSYNLVTLADRVYNCSNCGLSIDRDLNAARNIEFRALEKAPYLGWIGCREDSILEARHHNYTIG